MQDLPLSHFPQRKQMRLPHFDYSQAGWYYVTSCVAGRACLLGDVTDGVVTLNRVGQMVADAWAAIPRFYPGIGLDAYVVMPNHVHGIVVFADSQNRSGRMSLCDLMKRFLSLTTVRFLVASRTDGDGGRFRKLWQRGYYDHVIRNDADLDRIREYIRNNPRRWALDRD